MVQRSQAGPHGTTMARPTNRTNTGTAEKTARQRQYLVTSGDSRWRSERSVPGKRIRGRRHVW